MKLRLVTEYCPLRNSTIYWLERRWCGIWLWVDRSVCSSATEVLDKRQRIITTGTHRPVRTTLPVTDGTR